MMVWIFEHSKGSDTLSFTVWDDESHACQHACSHIVDHIRCYWNMEDVDQQNEAVTFNDFLVKGEWRKAVNYWHSNAIECDQEYGYNRYEVHQFTPGGPGGKPFKVIPLTDVELGITTHLQLQNPTDEDMSGYPQAYKATECGATCRACNTYNEYAYADKEDKTFMCTGCKVMSKIFGGTHD